MKKSLTTELWTSKGVVFFYWHKLKSGTKYKLISGTWHDNSVKLKEKQEKVFIYLACQPLGLYLDFVDVCVGHQGQKKVS